MIIGSQRNEGSATFIVSGLKIDALLDEKQQEFGETIAPITRTESEEEILSIIILTMKIGSVFDKQINDVNKILMCVLPDSVHKGESWIPSVICPGVDPDSCIQQLLKKIIMKLILLLASAVLLLTGLMNSSALF
jgi:hypothetical protein